MKVLIYNDFRSHVGGVETYCQELITGLESQGIQVKSVAFLSCPRSGWVIWQKAKKFVNRFLIRPRIVRHMRAIIEEFQPDLIPFTK